MFCFSCSCNELCRANSSSSCCVVLNGSAVNRIELQTLQRFCDMFLIYTSRIMKGNISGILLLQIFLCRLKEFAGLVDHICHKVLADICINIVITRYMGIKPCPQTPMKPSAATYLSCRVMLFENNTSIIDSEIPTDHGFLAVTELFPGYDLSDQRPFIWDTSR